MIAEELLRDGTFGVKEAADWSGLSISALYDLMSRNLLQYTKVGSRRLIPRAALARVLATGVPASDQGRKSGRKSRSRANADRANCS